MRRPTRNASAALTQYSIKPTYPLFARPTPRCCDEVMIERCGDLASFCLSRSFQYDANSTSRVGGFVNRGQGPKSEIKTLAAIKMTVVQRAGSARARVIVRAQHRFSAECELRRLLFRVERNCVR